MRPMLAQPIDMKRLLELAHADQWVFSPKIDGRRALVRVENGKVSVWARSGEKTVLPHRGLENTLTGTMPKGLFILDGELVRSADNLHHIFWFDLVQAGTVIGPSTPFSDRLIALETIGAKVWDKCVVMSNLGYAKGTEDKLKLLQRVYAHAGEGVVARHLDGEWTEGGRVEHMLKFKFRRTVDAEVVEKGRGGKDNLVLAVYRDGERVEIGEVTALAGNGRFAEVGMVVEVRYRGASPNGKLIEATKPMIRVDKAPTDCTWDQLVFSERVVV